MTEIALRVNGNLYTVNAEPRTPLLWVIRDHLGLTGTKYGCGIAQCGACTVHVGGKAVRSCMIPIEGLRGADVTTIEGLSQNGDHVLQRLWNELNVPQCGYCQAGMLMAAAAMLQEMKRPTDRDIDVRISNICRCGTYPRVRAAIHRATQST